MSDRTVDRLFKSSVMVNKTNPLPDFCFGRYDHQSNCFLKRIRLNPNTTTKQLNSPNIWGNSARNSAPLSTMPRSISIKYVTGNTQLIR